MTIDIRLASQEDLEGIISLNKKEYWDDPATWSSDSQMKRWQTGQWWADPYLLRWHFKVLNSCNGGILIAIGDNQIIGELDFVKSKDNVSGKSFSRYHIIWILVEDTWRREGIATQLIRELQEQTQLPIWVEAEDERSTNLYLHLGRPVIHISNWISRTIPQSKQMSLFESSSYHELQSKLKKDWVPILGRYFAPCYDYTQLQNSKPVHQFLWGETEGGRIIRGKFNETGFIAVLTQYPRMIVNPDFTQTDLELIIEFITGEVLNMGFTSVHVQVYNTGWLEEILKKVGYQCVVEEDPVYQLERFSSL